MDEAVRTLVSTEVTTAPIQTVGDVLALRERKHPQQLPVVVDAKYVGLTTTRSQPALQVHR